MFDLNELKGKKVADLHNIAKDFGLKGFQPLKKQDLIYLILDHQAANPSAIKNVSAAEPTNKRVEEAKNKNQNRFTKNKPAAKPVHAAQQSKTPPQKPEANQGLAHKNTDNQLQNTEITEKKDQTTANAQPKRIPREPKNFQNKNQENKPQQGNQNQKITGNKEFQQQQPQQQQQQQQ
ncbi:MAG: Rho termination factor N-terminal domain-containing protein, partial [Flavobacteriaceae bacterium]|nr:Rho termination factor N-terminal domain-containing protein [Flavobacteriaceae bacterium]